MKPVKCCREQNGFRLWATCVHIRIHSHPFKDIMADSVPQINVFSFPISTRISPFIPFHVPPIVSFPPLKKSPTPFSASLHSAFSGFPSFPCVFSLQNQILRREKWACAAHKFAFFSKEICHFNLPNLLRKIANKSRFSYPL